MMEISVIMATYKEKIELLKVAIESILKQTYNNFEFIIILDNPENIEHIRCIENYQKNDDRIRFYINEKNMGLTKTLNKALSLSKGKYICRMDADDVSMPDRIEKQLHYLNQYHYDLILFQSSYKLNFEKDFVFHLNKFDYLYILFLMYVLLFSYKTSKLILSYQTKIKRRYFYLLHLIIQLK